MRNGTFVSMKSNNKTVELLQIAYFSIVYIYILVNPYNVLHFIVLFDYKSKRLYTLSLFIISWVKWHFNKLFLWMNTFDYLHRNIFSTLIGKWKNYFFVKYGDQKTVRGKWRLSIICDVCSNAVNKQTIKFFKSKYYGVLKFLYRIYVNFVIKICKLNKV